MTVLVSVFTTAKTLRLSSLRALNLERIEDSFSRGSSMGPGEFAARRRRCRLRFKTPISGHFGCRPKLSERGR